MNVQSSLKNTRFLLVNGDLRSIHVDSSSGEIVDTLFYMLTVLVVPVLSCGVSPSNVNS